MPPLLIVILGGTIATCLTLWYLFYRQTNSGKGFVSFFIQLLNLHKIKWVNHIQERLRQAEIQTSHFFKNHKKAFALTLALSFFERLILIINYWLIVLFLGSQISLAQIMAIMALSVAVYLLPLPASLGGQEAGQTIVFGVFGLGASTGLVFSLIIRTMSLAGVIIGLIFLLNFEFKIIKQKASKFGNKLTGFFDKFS